MLTPDPELAVSYGLFSVDQALASGISYAEIARGVRRGRWERVARGVLQDAGRAARPGDDLLIAVLRAGPGAVAGFDSAAQVEGWDLLKSPAKPRLIVPLGSHQPKAGPLGYRAALGQDEITVCGVIPLTSPCRTALDVAATAPLAEAVVTIDSALRSRAVTSEQLQRAFTHSQRQHIKRAREVLALTDPLSGSVPETQARLLFREAGLPDPVTQFRVVVGGEFIARADFAWPWARLIAEIDGFAYHSASGDFQRDRERQNALLGAGWRVVRFTVPDIRTRERYVIAVMWDALG